MISKINASRIDPSSIGRLDDIDEYITWKINVIKKVLMNPNLIDPIINPIIRGVIKLKIMIGPSMLLKESRRIIITNRIIPTIIPNVNLLFI
jgi:hypothetical protein